MKAFVRFLRRLFRQHRNTDTISTPITRVIVQLQEHAEEQRLRAIRDEEAAAATLDRARAEFVESSRATERAKKAADTFGIDLTAR